MGTKNFLILFDALSKTNWEELTENQLLKIYKEGLNIKGAQTSRPRFVEIIRIGISPIEENSHKSTFVAFFQKYVTSAKLPY